MLQEWGASFCATFVAPSMNNAALSDEVCWQVCGSGYSVSFPVPWCWFFPTGVVSQHRNVNAKEPCIA